ncbi:efflux transporter outer membrane subunit [Luteolibacter marinus]|uniref:efflux transporter outer membrane subunit n=1 Tax=Luteolibacter marinus TaxID=2776705 RepID=UPI0018663FF4|nr:efflux transporter outer membrane subunit [Luteolibacter marinus]
MLPCGLATLLLAGCAVGPDYEMPAEELEVSFKNAGFTAPPPEGSWWTLFNEPELNRLIRDADTKGQGVRSALARYDEARAALGLAAADAYPAVTGDAYARRQQDSGNTNFSAGAYEDYRTALNLSWEIDLWGRVRRNYGAASARMEAAGYEYQGVILSVHGEIARAYVSLRFADAEIALLTRTGELRSEARRLMKTRFDRGASSRIDYERSVTEDESVQAELADLRARRGKFENALAVLTGRSASGFRVSANGALPAIPAAPPAVPSDLLRRRPDLAAAERQLAAASETIGLAIASYLPKLSLTGSGGFRSLSTSDLFDSGSKLWTLGPELSLPLFQGGRGFSDKKRAEAAYREALGIYRGKLLEAIRETEDSLVDSRQLAAAAGSRSRGAKAAATTARLTRKRYTAGVTDYFEVVDAERTALAEERAELAINLSRALAATRLIQALGGGWQR